MNNIDNKRIKFCALLIIVGAQFYFFTTATKAETTSPEHRHRTPENILESWNKDIFWAPASGFAKSGHWTNVFGDEARSVLGPIPDIECGDEVGIPFKAEADGYQIEAIRRNEKAIDSEYRKRSYTGSLETKTGLIELCDKPSLANTYGHACGTNSRISVMENANNENVTWVTLCRKNDTRGLVMKGDYWDHVNPNFSLLGIIGFNRKAGEVVFFDGTDFTKGRGKSSIFTWKTRYPPPGGFGYEDHEGRQIALDTYWYTKRIKCETCHDNKEPWVITPHLKYAGFGYRDEKRKARFGLVNPLPLVQPRSDEAPYRVIGTRFTSSADLSSKTFRDPTGSCTYCHTLTTDWTGKVLAYDAVGRINENQPYKSFFEKVDRSRTDWAKQKGNTHPWMTPWLGPNVIPNTVTGLIPSEIDEKNWKRIADCINETSNEDCHYKQVYTSCPEPESLKTDCSKEDELNNRCARLADPFGPSEMTAVTTLLDEEIDPALPYDMKATVSWSYLNGLGGVPQRDDVRFNLAIREVRIPDDRSDPAIGDYPSLQAAVDPYFADLNKKGKVHYCDQGKERKKICHIIKPEQGEFFINNISYAGHVRNTTPEPALKPRQYSVVIPTQCNKRYLARLVPKRFCFDRSGVLASNVDHVKYFDVRCKAE